ncbi:MAG TPA: DUF2252 family protein [Candidatus Binataceae bacterium]|nr:DUF2252 family protein [Candidatus Binataceae bacterium]
MNVSQATKSFEQWLRTQTNVVESALRHKHEQMKADLFSFYRGTFYRWIELWSQGPKDLQNAPSVLAVGDLHVDSFGTWRDLEGRLAWGVDDFDEAYPLPYTNDLVRLATSVKVVVDAETLSVSLKSACDIILQGYEQSIKDNGRPVILAEEQRTLETLGVREIKPAENFWQNLNQLPVVRSGLPTDARTAMEHALPKGLVYKTVKRQAGVGSLGQARFVALGEWKGGFVAREAKAMVPSSCVWLQPTGDRRSYYDRIIGQAVRSHDPFQRVVKGYLIRRLAPDSNPISILDWPGKRDEEALLYSMGAEAANVHLGSKAKVPQILKDLKTRPTGWLKAAAKHFAKATERDWQDYRKG